VIRMHPAEASVLGQAVRTLFVSTRSLVRAVYTEQATSGFCLLIRLVEIKMPGTKKDLPGFSEFVRRVLKLKGLTQKDVQRISRGRITDGYVASITVGRATNLSVAKIQALADGLGVDVDTLFQVACGVSDDKIRRTYTDDSLMILETVQKAVTSPDVSEILREAVRMSPEERRVLLKSMKRASKPKSIRKTKSTRKTRQPRNQAS